MTPEYILLVINSLLIVGLSIKLFHYRAAIIKLQADMTLVLNELTRPMPVQLKKVK